MLLKREREELCLCYKKMLDTGLTNGTSGNVSLINRKEQLIAISPTGVSFDKLKLENISIVDLDGNLIEGLKPSSELEMHQIIYKNRNDISAIIHGHTVFATTISCLREDLPAIDYMIAVAGGKNVKCAEYATYGTRELARNVLKAMIGRKAALLANHGIIVGAGDIHNAFHIIEQIEYVAELYVRTKSIGDPVILTDDEMDKMVELFKNYGQIKN
ncbi:MAG: L-fuculose-phosphate aldolase [Candidatus Marinimicrobia bacterium]|nr:L-fuculose-phosphate aldolase [Candidatus Neomarinimicrobiota bacterium]